MKRIALLSAALFSLVAISIAPLTGCSSFGTNSYKTVASVQVTADAAMTAWGDYVAKFHPGVSAEQKVKDAYQKYQAAMIAVADAGQAYTQAAGTTNAPTAQTILNAALANASGLLSDLVGVIESFGVKVT